MIAYSIDLWNVFQSRIDQAVRSPRPHRMDLETFILANEPAVRLGFFVGVLVVVAAWEALAHGWGLLNHPAIICHQGRGAGPRSGRA
jgi:hypothetical protein